VKRKKKKKIGPGGALLGAAIFPIAVIFELTKNPKYQTQPKRRKRRR